MILKGRGRPEPQDLGLDPPGSGRLLTPGVGLDQAEVALQPGSEGGVTRRTLAAACEERARQDLVALMRQGRLRVSAPAAALDTSSPERGYSTAVQVGSGSYSVIPRAMAVVFGPRFF